MNKRLLLWVLMISGVLGLMACGVSMAQDSSPKPRPKKEQPVGDRGTERRPDRPEGGEERGGMRPREGDFEGPPFGPRRNRDKDGAPRRPQGDEEMGPPRWNPGDGEGVGRPPMPHRDGDRERMGHPGFGGGRPPFADRSMPMGPPRWPHEDWGSMEKNDPEMYQLLKSDMDLDRQVREQAMQYARAPKDQREQIRKQVQELVDKHFDVRQQRRSLELKRLEEELKRMREAMDRREKLRKDLVDKRVAELIGSNDVPGF